MLPAAHMRVTILKYYAPHTKRQQSSCAIAMAIMFTVVALSGSMDDAASYQPAWGLMLVRVPVGDSANVARRGWRLRACERWDGGR
eukprot:SAG11_NODE_6529_length_1294_cov_1.587448_2_plen_86_part_00